MKRSIAAALGTVLVTAVPAAAQSVTVALNADIRSTNPGVNRDDNTDAVVLHMVEGLVGYARRNFLVPVPQVESLAALNAGLEACCRERQGARLRGQQSTDRLNAGASQRVPEQYKRLVEKYYRALAR